MIKIDLNEFRLWTRDAHRAMCTEASVTAE